MYPCQICGCPWALSSFIQKVNILLMQLLKSSNITMHKIVKCYNFECELKVKL